MKILSIFIRMSNTAPAPAEQPVFDRQNAPIYYYGGHGNDVCDPRTRVPIVRIVPDNCIYITISECGFKTFIQGGEEDFFRHKLSRFLLRYPDVADHKQNIAKAVKRKPNWLHIHMPGTPYVVSHLHPFGYWHNQAEAGLAVSGLAEKSLLEGMGDRGLYFLKKPLRVFKDKSGAEVISMIRKNTQEDPFGELKQNKAIEMLEEITPPREEFYDTMFNADDINHILAEVNIVVSKDKLLEYFEASVHPTNAEAAGFLEKRFPGQEVFFSSEFAAIDELLHQKMNPEHRAESDPMFPLSNTYMMKFFPGIHYNVVCREVGRSCYVGLQRTLSGIQEARREGKEYPLHPLKTFDQIQTEVQRIVTKPTGSFRQKSTELKRYLSDRASNIYLLPEEQKQVLFDYLLSKRFIRANDVSPTINSNVFKYYIKPNVYRLQLAGAKTRKQRASKRKTRKNLSTL